MSQASSDTWIHSPKRSPLLDPLRSSGSGKKIRRSHFKTDVAVKSYKCDFSGSDINTAAKLYVSNTALYVVHRPKRKKLTTIPFTLMRDLSPRLDKCGVDVCLNNGLVYTFTNFQRTESAVAFLLNYWNLVRKGKSVQSGLDNSGSTGRFSTTSCDARLSLVPTDASPRLPKAPTTISLNSTASMSDTGSFDCRLSNSSSNIKPESNDSRLSQPYCSDSPDTTTKRRNDSPSIAQRTLKPPSQNSSYSKVGRSPLAVTANSKNSDGEVTQHSATAPYLRADTAAAVTLAHQPSDSNNSRSTAYQQLSPSSSPSRSKPVVCLTESPGWSVGWPLSFLPYTFSSPPQRLTMLIAYAILAFLLLSTMHLYHRLAVFDLHGNPDWPTPHQSSLTAHEYRAGLEYLEIQLVHLTRLVGQLTESLMKLTSELRSLQPTAGSHVTSPPSGTPDSAPPVL